uniref:Transposase n=1 Tax=Gongylonema pulchrum TaxID=637853 RepID=A0A183DLK2_9BILA
LIAWMYVACELYDPATSVTQPLPWTYRQSNKPNFRLPHRS